MVAAYLGIEPTGTTTTDAGSLEQAAEFIPVNTINKTDFDDLLRRHGLPTGE